MSIKLKLGLVLVFSGVILFLTGVITPWIPLIASIRANVEKFGYYNLQAYVATRYDWLLWFTLGVPVGFLLSRIGVKISWKYL